MGISKAFRIALFMSLGIHMVLLSPIPGIVMRPHETSQANVEVTYVPVEEEKMRETETAARLSPKTEMKEEVRKPPVEAKATAAASAKADEALAGKVVNRQALKKTEPLKGTLPRKDKTAIYFSEPTLDLDIITSHAADSESLNFLTSIRDKISYYVHKNYNLSMGEGKALLHFVLKADGSVESATILQDNLADNELLRSLCLESIRRSAPFSAFPETLDLPTAAFKISISFKRR